MDPSPHMDFLFFFILPGKKNTRIRKLLVFLFCHIWRNKILIIMKLIWVKLNCFFSPSRRFQMGPGLALEQCSWSSTQFTTNLRRCPRRPMELLCRRIWKTTEDTTKSINLFSLPRPPLRRPVDLAGFPTFFQKILNDRHAYAYYYYYYYVADCKTERYASNDEVIWSNKEKSNRNNEKNECFH